MYRLKNNKKREREREMKRNKPCRLIEMTQFVRLLNLLSILFKHGHLNLYIVFSLCFICCRFFFRAALHFLCMPLFLVANGSVNAFEKQQHVYLYFDDMFIHQ